MPNPSHFRKLENMYRSAPINQFYQPRMTIGTGIAEIVIPVKEIHFHAAGAVHGAVYFKLMDDSAFFAANSLVEDVFVLTTSFHLHLLRPVSSGEMRAVGKVVHQSRSQIIAESVVYDSEGQEVSRGSGTFVRGHVALTPEIGYK